MSNEPTATIHLNELKPLVQKHNLAGLVIIAIRPDDACQIASYGKDKRQCTRFAKVTEQVAELIDDEAIDFDE